MTEIARIVDQLDRAFDGDAWHGDALMVLLRSVDATQGVQHPVRGGHSIWEVALHIGHWLDAARRRTGGEVYDAFDHPDNWRTVADSSEQAWRGTLDGLRERYEGLRAAVAAFPDSRLGDTVGGKDYNFYVLFHGVIQHTLYHAGQISVLKRGVARSS